MKFHLTKRHGILLVALVNLAVAVISLAIHASAKLDPHCRTPEAVFSFVTFPLAPIVGSGCVSGNIMFWTGSVWATPFFYALIVLNACIWGVVGMCLCGWCYRTFWIKPEQSIPFDGNDLKWDTLFVVFTHAVLLLLLFGVLAFLAPVPSRLLGIRYGAVPASAAWLIVTSTVWRHSVVNLLLAIGFLYADGGIYSWLCRSRGKRAGTIWAIGVSLAIAVAIVWYAVLSLMYLNTAIEWRLK
jgi:hypothetical protein